MAATRKLQGEIDRCLKKVTEGVDTFEDIWQKVHNATNSNQKEKYEADLKKEIKKLQRLRDQIKAWIASAEIKDKSSLVEYRRLIETQMERFKVVERETKTKAYSKEGLGAAQKLDPAQRMKDDVRTWLNQSIRTLQIQTEKLESEIESLLAGKKKRLDKDKQDRNDELQAILKRHRFHIKKLEMLLRMLDNDGVEVELIRRIKDDVEYYIDSSQDPDFEENEYLYDDITGLDEVEMSGIGANEGNDGDDDEDSSSLISGSSPVMTPTIDCNVNFNHNSETGSVEFSERKNKSENVVGSKVTPVKPTAVRAAKTDLNQSTTSTSNLSSLKQSIVCSTPNKATTQSISLAPAPPPVSATTTSSSLPTSFQPITTTSVAPIAFSAVAKHNTSQENGPVMNQFSAFAVTLTTTSTTSLPIQSTHTNQPVINTIQSIQAPVSNAVSSANNILTSLPNSTPSTVSDSHTIMTSITSTTTSNSIVNCVSPTNSIVSSRTTPPLTSPKQPQQQQPQHLLNGPTSAIPGTPNNKTISMPSAEPLKTIAQEAVNRRVGLDNSSPLLPIPVDTRQLFPDQTVSNGPNPNSLTSTNNVKVAGTNEAHIPPLLGVAPLGTSPLLKEHQLQFQMMEQSYYHLPTPSDSERLRAYLHRQPVQTPAYYPQSQLPHSDTVEFFQRLSTETLFFVFYYMEGTKAQYLAAKALKKQSWRFHTKYMMWFQRHEEPKIINEEFEQGTYIYFDYEKWGQRKKEGFTFEYKYLEDRDLN
ncbi:CCR4-NOT transcription complex subunit 3 [Pseudolycoriella hygida]|uniref:CCR4-NOT transcription complex subunit 3 n=1 Tax=Pseudolycoriella hygida TaxID=35572 RepID=A0A9Q0S9Y8_9DIPT|nr:CCR4-NOT transcription complex subunit 3 [Pseudolycoriella hygida]